MFTSENAMQEVKHSENPLSRMLWPSWLAQRHVALRLACALAATETFVALKLARLTAVSPPLSPSNALLGMYKLSLLTKAPRRAGE